MKTLNVVTLSMIVSMLSVATVNFASQKADGKQSVGRGSSNLGRFQPWSPGWIRPETRLANNAAKESFRVEQMRSPSTL